MQLIEFLRRYPRKLLLFTVVLNALLHFPFITQPPCSIHVWRQCNTLAVARNFLEEDANIFQPRVDRRYDTDGITGMQFPLYEWKLSFLYKIFGEHYAVHRSFSLLITSIGIFFLFCFMSLITGNEFIGACCAWCYTWSPELFYDGFNALPDILALATGIASLYFFLQWIKNKKLSFFLLSLLLITISGLVKLQYLMFGALMLGFVIDEFIQNKKSFSSQEKLMLFSGIFPVIITLSWYHYATNLIASSGLTDYGLEFRPENNLQEALAILKKNLLSDWPELILNFANTILLLTGIVLLFFKKKWKSRKFLPFFLPAILYLTFHIIELRQMKVHQYYMLPSLLIAIPLIALSVQFLVEKRMYFLLLLLLIAGPILASIRILPARWMKEDKGIPVEFSNAEQLNRLVNALPQNSKVIVGPDESGCIYFYFLHQRGFGFEHSEDLLIKNNEGQLAIENYIQRGAKYLITSDQFLSEKEEISPFVDKLFFSEGQFRIYTVKPVKQAVN